MYVLWLFVEGKRTQALGQCPTLRQAYEQATDLRFTHKFLKADIRIVGLATTGLLRVLGDDAGGDSDAAGPAHRWFIVDSWSSPDVRLKKASIDVEVALRLLGDEDRGSGGQATTPTQPRVNIRSPGRGARKALPHGSPLPTGCTKPAAQASSESAGYSVMRRLHDQVSVAAHGIASLEAARRIAAERKREERDRRAKFYILAPRRMPISPAGSAQHESLSARNAAKPAAAESARQIPPAASERRSSAAPASAPSPSRQPPTLPKPGTRFVVYRVRGEQRQPMPGVFTTHKQARAHALSLQKRDSDSTVTYEVVYRLPPSSKPARSSMSPPTPSTSKRARRRARTPHSDQDERPRRGARREWEDDDEDNDGYRYDDRFPRPDDLLGIGIPAQWGKGRRSRKGLYIP